MSIAIRWWRDTDLVGRRSVMPVDRVQGTDVPAANPSTVQHGGSEAGPCVLVVEDDASTRTLLVRTLELESFDTAQAATAAEARRAIRALSPTLVLLDLQLPDGDGLSVLEELRQVAPDAGCIVVSGREEEASRVLGLRLGADDYIVKPFSSAELLARVGAVLRRCARHEGPVVLERGDLRIDLASREVRRLGQPIQLTAKEYELLLFLASAPRQVFTREQLLEQVWSSSRDWQDTATVTEHVRRLRRKLEDDPDRPALIETVRGVGYRFAGG